MKQSYIFLIIFILISLCVSANEYCRNSICSNNIYYAGSSTTSKELNSSLTGSLPLNNPSNFFTFCNPSASVFPVSGGNLDGDISQNEYILATTTTNLEIITTDCGLVDDHVLSEIIISAPNIVSLGTSIIDKPNRDQMISVITNTSVFVYTLENNTIIQNRNVTYNSSIVGDFGSCYDNICIVRDQRDIYVVDLDSQSATMYNNVLCAACSTQVGKFHTGKFRDGSYGAYICSVGTTTMSCSLIKDDGTSVFTKSEGSASFTNNNPASLDSYIINIKGNDRIVNTGMTTKFSGGTPVSHDYTTNVYSMAGTVIYTITSLNPVSKLMIGNYDKVGDLEGCQFQNHSSNIYFTCYDETFTSVLYNSSHSIVDYASQEMLIDNNSFMFDINNSNQYLAVANQNGIYYLPSEELIKETNASITTSGGVSSSLVSIFDSNLFNVVLTPLYWAGQPTLYISNGVDAEIIFAGEPVFTTCGDGQCNGDETLSSCIEDCLEDIFPGGNTLNCSIDANCPIGFPKCVDGHCVSGYNVTQTCGVSADCPIGKFCVNGYCVDGVSGLPISDVEDTNQDNINDNLNPSSMKFFIALLIFLAFTFMPVIFFHGTSALGVVCVITSWCGMLLNVKLGLLPVIFLVLYSIIAIGLGLYALRQNGG